MGKLVIALAVFSLSYMMAGTYDISEEIVMEMPQEAYEAVMLKVGDNASYTTIAKEYLKNQKYYDSFVR